MKTKLYPENLYFSPFAVYERFEGILKKYGKEAVLKRSKFKMEREIWTTGCFALGAMKYTANKYWVGSNSDGTTPDTFLVSLRSEGKMTYKDVCKIEIFDWQQHSKQTLLEAIKAKLKNKRYPASFVVLCHVHGRPGQSINFNELVDGLRLLKPEIGQIWILSSVKTTRQDDCCIVQVYPAGPQVFFSQNNELANHKDQPRMVETKRGMGGFYETIIKPLPLP